MKIGHGFDAHKFESQCKLVLGGVSIEHHPGLAAHSDGDVVIHALCDALLGAMGLGDIGIHFPDGDERYKNVDSRILLRRVNTLLEAEQLSLGNADITIIAQVPKLAPYLAAMRTNITKDLNADEKSVNVKATTTERLGFTGREEGIAVHAVVLLKKID